MTQYARLNPKEEQLLREVILKHRPQLLTPVGPNW
jgi:hypothetical protein